ncbi:hypothetical protein [Sphingomonas aurea]|nr:hypothetical protein [Sphingomonas sp. KR1UV-12]
MAVLDRTQGFRRAFWRDVSSSVSMGFAREAVMDSGDRQVAMRRTAEMAAVFMIGDGLLGILQPTRHVELWRSRFVIVDNLVRPFGGRPGRRRGYGVVQLVAGLALASRLRAPAKSVTAGDIDG